MNRPARTTDDEASSWLRREAIVERFELEWRSARKPDIAEFLSAESVDEPLMLLAELVKVDLEYQWASGTSSRAVRRVNVCFMFLFFYVGYFTSSPSHQPRSS